MEDGGDRFACARVCVKLWVERLCMLSVMYCIALEAFAWPSPAVCDQISVCLTPPSTFLLSPSLTPVLLQFPSSLSAPVHHSVLMILSLIFYPHGEQGGRKREGESYITAISVRSQFLPENPTEKQTCVIPYVIFCSVRLIKE